MWEFHDIRPWIRIRGKSLVCLSSSHVVQNGVARLFDGVVYLTVTIHLGWPVLRHQDAKVVISTCCSSSNDFVATQDLLTYIYRCSPLPGRLGHTSSDNSQACKHHVWKTSPSRGMAQCKLGSDSTSTVRFSAANQ